MKMKDLLATAPRLEVEVRRADPHDPSPEKVELVFRRVYDEHTAHAYVQRLTEAELEQTHVAISYFFANGD
jgi:hypothetical protein